MSQFFSTIAVGDLFKIKPEWRDDPAEGKFVYAVKEVLDERTVLAIVVKGFTRDFAITPVFQFDTDHIDVTVKAKEY